MGFFLSIAENGSFFSESIGEVRQYLSPNYNLIFDYIV